jgi:hypothetical protein
MTGAVCIEAMVVIRVIDGENTGKSLHRHGQMRDWLLSESSK